MNFRALEYSIRVLEKSWKSPGNLCLKKGTNPVNGHNKSLFLMTEYHSLIHCTLKWGHLIARQWLIHSGIHQYDL